MYEDDKNAVVEMSKEYHVIKVGSFKTNFGHDTVEGVVPVTSGLLETVEIGLELENLSRLDSDNMSHPDCHPIAGYVFTIGGAISWSSKWQDLVCLSTTEAEYVALSHAVKETIWLRNLLNKLFLLKVPPSITVHCDNQAAITLLKDDCFHAWTKPIDICFHFVCEAVEKVRCTSCIAQLMI